MLRRAVILVAAVALVASLVAVWLQGPRAIPAAVVAAIVLIGGLFENHRYKAVLSQQPPRGWEATGERFIDPETGELVDVYYNSATGERCYIAARMPFMRG